MKILIVDDDVEFSNMITEWLTCLGYEVCNAFTGEQALNILRKRDKPDVLLSDLDLSSVSEIDGDTILSHLKELSPKTVPVVMTAHVEETAKKRLKDKGAVTILFKPIKLDDLAGVLEKIEDEIEK